MKTGLTYEIGKQRFLHHFLEARGVRSFHPQDVVLVDEETRNKGLRGMKHHAHLAGAPPTPDPPAGDSPIRPAGGPPTRAEPPSGKPVPHPAGARPKSTD